jgi:hypothetical protein
MITSGKPFIKTVISSLLFSVTFPAFSLDSNLDLLDNNPTSLYNFFRFKVDFNQIITVSDIKTLIAQMSQPDQLAHHVNEFDQFVAIGSINDGNSTIISQFNKDQFITEKKTYDHPWVGVANFDRKELPLIGFQQGWKNAQACMNKKGYVLSDKLAGFAIYKTIGNNNIIYDYIVPVNGQKACQEVLYRYSLREGNWCDFGMMRSCHYTIQNGKILHN